MKASLYIQYPTRSLLRGGQRTILAVFCVTVGVMAIVALQLSGFMLQSSLSTSARDANGGDIAVQAAGAPFTTSDLNFFATLKNKRTITNYSSVASSNGALSNASAANQFFTINAVDPTRYPLVSPPTFVSPSGATLAHLLTANQVVVTENFLATYQKHLGDTFTTYVKTQAGSGETLTVKIAGVIANSGTFVQAGNLLLISAHDYLLHAPAPLDSYALIDINTLDAAHTHTAVQAINRQFALVTTQTATDVLQGEQSSIDLLNKFLEISGLIALLIGGIGIINTMQVLLSRRKTEIAMLKTAGYHRSDLYLLFGLEAGLLGVVGGVIGAAAAIGVSYLIRILLLNLGTNVPFVLNAGLIGGGILVGFATALIFGLLPIVQAAGVRPLQVLREQEATSLGSRFTSFLLLLVFSVLFCLLAIFILNNDIVLGFFVTYGTFAFLLFLSGLFGLILLGVSKLPVPEGLNVVHLVLVVIGLTLGVLAYLVVPVVGLFFIVLSLLGCSLPFLPKSWKVDVKMALRNIGRRRARTTATLLALFIGVFGIAIDIGFGQDLSSQITGALAQNSPYNLVATTVGQDATTLRTHLNSIPGVKASRVDPFVETLPLTIDGQPARDSLPGGSSVQHVLSDLGGIEGYNLHNELPAQKVIQGRNLNSSDAATNNVLVSQIMTSSGWDGMHLKVGDTLTMTSLDKKVQRTLTIVGIVSVPTSFETLGKVLAPIQTVNALASTTTSSTTVFYMKVGPDQIDAALHALNQVVPNASVQNLSDAAVSFLQQVSSFLDMLLAVAALSMLAAVVIIANSVALAMLERRRELGILKSVGYTSSTILSQVIVENGIIGALGSIVALVLASYIVTAGSNYYFNHSLTLSIQPIVVASLTLGTVLLAILTAVLVAWSAVRVRPLVVLKYE